MRPFRLILPVILAAVAMVSARAQEPSALTGSSLVGTSTGVPTLGSGAAGEIELAVETAVVFKNLELFNLPDILGRTWFLTLSEPRLRYRVADNLVLEGGVLLGRNLGDEADLDIHRPVLRIVHQVLPGVHVIAGTLIATHWIHEAMLDDVGKLETDIEEGFQLRSDRDHYTGDTWLNWRVREKEVEPEEFEIASCHRAHLLNRWLRIQGQFMWTHAGGQVSLSGRVAQNLMYAAGCAIGPGLRSGDRLGWRAGYDHLWSRDESDLEPLVTGDGREAWVRLDVRLRPGLTARIRGARFRGDGLVSGRGDPLYGLDRYSHLGVNLLQVPVGTGLAIEAGFVQQWTDDQTNLTYQLNMVWNGVFRLGRKLPAAPAGTAP